MADLFESLAPTQVPLAERMRPKSLAEVAGQTHLLGAGKLPKDHPVACRVLDIDAAEQSELSLIENVIRLDMTPTDEIRAYKHFVNEGSDLDAIDTRTRAINRRLRDIGEGNGTPEGNVPSGLDEPGDLN